MQRRKASVSGRRKAQAVNLSKWKPVHASESVSVSKKAALCGVGELCPKDNDGGTGKKIMLEIALCQTCGEEIDDGYGECEDCGKFFCSEHNALENGICADCRSDGIPF